MNLRSLPRLTFGLLLAVLLSLFAATAAAEESTSTERTNYAALADILEDENAREQLIRVLREQSDEVTAADEELAESGGLVPGTEEAYEISFARRVANASQHVAENFVAEFSSGVDALRSLGQAGPSVDVGAITAAITNLAILILATVVLFLVLRRVARPMFAAANRWARGGGANLFRNGVAIVASAILDFVVIVLAYVGGFIAALYVLGEPGEMDARESLFLNAFLVVEVFKAIIRILFAAKDEELRILPMTSEQAAYWNAWLARLSGFIGYGILLVVPMINFNVSPALGRMTALVIMGLAFLYALVIILQNRTLLSERLEARARQADLGFSRLLLSMLAGLWRVLRGPSRADRMLAAQLFGTTGVAILVLMALLEGQRALLDVALTLAVLAAVSVVAFVASTGSGGGPGGGRGRP